MATAREIKKSHPQHQEHRADHPRAGSGLRLARAARAGARAGKPRLCRKSVGNSAERAERRDQRRAAAPAADAARRRQEHHDRPDHVGSRAGGRVQHQHHPRGAALSASGSTSRRSYVAIGRKGRDSLIRAAPERRRRVRRSIGHHAGADFAGRAAGRSTIS